MKTQVEFRSSNFPPYDGEEDEINPGVWGKRLAQYWVEKLAPLGIKSDGLIAEDWGWYIPLKNDGFRLGLCCGHQSGDDDQFLCFTEPSIPVVRKMFSRDIDAREQLTRLTTAMHEILATDPGIHEIAWIEVG